MSTNPEKPFFDNPDHPDTSSIGGIWPPLDSSDERIKAFYNLSSIQDERSLCILQQRFERESQRLNGQTLTRLQFRALFGDQFLRSNSHIEFLQRHVEAIVPIEKKSRGNSLALVYLGLNNEARPCSALDLEVIQSNYIKARDIESRSAGEIFSRALSNGYSIEILDKEADRERSLDQLAQLYTRFNRSLADVTAMVDSPSNIFSVIRSEGQIVSAAIAELGEIPFPSGNLHVVEVTEAATREGFGDLGLYTAASTKLLIEIANLSWHKRLGYEIDLVFGECNALSLGVLTAVKRQGRTFSAEVCPSYGFDGRGLLLQQVPIGGVPRHTQYNDLLPAFLTPTKLYAKYLL